MMIMSALRSNVIRPAAVSAPRARSPQSGSMRSSMIFFGRALTEPTLCSIRHVGHAMHRRLLLPLGAAECIHCCRKHFSPAMHAGYDLVRTRPTHSRQGKRN